MQDAGYNTYYSGKLWNGHTVSNYNETFAKGFNGSEFLLDPYTYKYYDSVMTRNGAEPISYAGNYSTDVIKDKILGFLDEALPMSGHGSLLQLRLRRTPRRPPTRQRTEPTSTSRSTLPVTPTSSRTTRSPGTQASTPKLRAASAGSRTCSP